MRKLLIIALVLVSCFQELYSQNIGINNPTPDPTSILDLTSTTQGLLIPRMSTIQRNNIGFPGVPAASLLVYDVDINRFMFYNSSTSTWNSLFSSGLAWETLGNSGTNPLNNFLGTIDNQDMVFKTFSIERMRLDTNGAVGINQSAPDVKSILHITSNSKGVLLPRLSSIDRTTLIANGSALDGARDGLLVYDTNIKNFLSWNALSFQWDTILSRNMGAGIYWQLLGNSATNPLINYIGTTDSTDLVFRTNGTERFRITANGLFYTANQGPGISNIFMGALAGSTNTGTNNAGFGLQALESNTTGYGNSALGSFALADNTTGYENTGVGIESLRNNTTGYGNTSVGERSGYGNTTAYGNTSIGRFSLYSNQTGLENVALGDSTLSAAPNVGNNNIAVGNRSMVNNTGNDNISVGTLSLYNKTSGSQNVAIGYQAGFYGTNPIRNIMIGSTTMREARTTAVANIAIGYMALNRDTIPRYNTIVGDLAMTWGIQSDSNVAVGFRSMTNSGNIPRLIGNKNTAVGSLSMQNVSTGSLNVAIGAESMNIATLTGDSNTVIGFKADLANAALYNAAAFGNGAVAWASNVQRFGNTTTLKWGFGSNPVAARALQVGTNATNGNAAYLTTGGVWTNASDVNLKENIQPVDPSEILIKINQLEISKWKYMGTEFEEYHIGPMAQDFYKLFKVGVDSCSISTIDPAGVALAGIQQLSKEFEQIRTTSVVINTTLLNENAQLKVEIESLKLRLERLENMLKDY